MMEKHLIMHQMVTKKSKIFKNPLMTVHLKMKLNTTETQEDALIKI